MTAIRYKQSSPGIKALLNSGETRAMLTGKAQNVLAAAQADAPFVTGNYRNGLKIVQETTDRAVVRVAGTAPHSHLVEANHGVLARALDSA